MQKKRFYYLIRVQFLGFRYSGWQKQPNQRTIEGMLVKTLKFILPGTKFKILGAGRTDAKVSALGAAFELFLWERPIEDFEEFLDLFNTNLPPDIRILEITETNELFNIIQNGREKEYIYLFSYGEKNHPFCAPLLTNVLGNLDLNLMKEGAKKFEGEHDFSTYTARLQKNTKSVRTLYLCEILPNTQLTASFFPEKSYALHIKGQGFMRYQVRMIMGALIQLGRGELSLIDIEESLLPNNTTQLTYVAPGSGLLLNKIEFKRLFWNVWLEFL